MRARGPGGSGPPILGQMLASQGQMLASRGQMLASQGQMLACPDRCPLTLGHGLD